MPLLQHPPDPAVPTVATDLEGTLTAGVTWRGMYNYLLQHGRVPAAWWFYATHLPKYIAFKVFGGDFGKFKNDWLRDLLRIFKGYSVEEFGKMCTWVVENELWPKRRKAVVTELEAHLSSGRRAILVTGVYDSLLEKLLHKLPGLEAIGTTLVWENNHFSGEMERDFNTGENKREKLRPFTQNGKIYAAYGDTNPDVPMLEMSEYPVAVHPDEELRETAQLRGWRIMEGEDGRM